MTRYLLDTSVIISYLRGKQEWVARLDALDGEFLASYISLAELYEGIFRVDDQKRAEQGVLDFFAGLSEVVGIDRDIAKEFGRIRAVLKKGGAVIEDLDILLAATCLAHRLVLVTVNVKHFRRIKGLQIYS